MLKRTDAMMILRKRNQGLYLKDIAAQMGCSERTVRRVIKRGSPPSGRRPRARGSILDPYKPMIDALLAEGITNCRVILNKIRQAGYQGGRSILHEYVRPKRPAKASRATVRFETAPGQQLQHDWGELDTLINGERRRVHFAVNTLGCSRRFHVFAAPCEDAEHTYESLVRAFEHFGGVPAEVLVDNQKTTVLDWAQGTARFNGRFLELAEFYHFTPRACRPRRARTKGKTERMVQYIKYNFFQHYQAFESFSHLNACLERWLAEEADERRHGTHRMIVRERFERDDAPALQPLPRGRFDTAYHFHRQAGWDGYVQVKGNRYSVPAAYCGETVACRLTLAGQLIIYGRHSRTAGFAEPIAHHVLTDPRHGWQQVPSHHEALWREALPVEVRDLAVYEEVSHAT